MYKKNIKKITAIFLQVLLLLTSVIGGIMILPRETQAAIAVSAANQTFEVGQVATAISQITITDDVGGEITAANDIRIAISTSTHGMRWDTTDTTAIIGGTASAKASTTVSYEGGGSVLVIPVDINFAAGETLTVSGLSFTSFTTVVAASAGLTLLLDGASDITANATDNKTITIKGYGTLANHTIGQVGNKIDYSVISTTTDFFRFKLSNTGEQASTTLKFDLTGVSGISTADLSNLLVYKDTGSDGVYATSSNWAVAYDTAKSDVYGFILDPVNNVMYAGAKNGVIFRCPTSNNCNEAADWTAVFDDTNTSTTGFYDFGFDSKNNVLYIGTIGTGIIYRCETSTGCDAQAEWTTSYDSAETSIRDFVFDPVNNVMYASTRSNALIYRCDTATLCDAAADWTTAADKTEGTTGLYGMGYDSTNGVIYAGGGSTGTIYRCATSTGCDINAEWTTAYDTTAVAILPFTFDSANGVMYAGEAGGTANARIFRCDTTTLCDAATDWTVGYTTPAPQIAAMTFDSSNNAIYVNGTTDITFKCLTSTLCDAATDWTTDYDGAGDFPWDIYYNVNQNALYRSINVTGIIFQKTLGEPIAFSGGVVNISGTSGTITFSATTTLDQAATDYVLRGTVSNIVTDDVMTVGLNSSKLIQYGLTTGSLLNVSGSASNITHGTGIASPGTIMLQAHAAGNITNAFGLGVTELTNESMYAFKLTPATENFTISRLAFVIMGLRGITQSDISSSTLIVDANNNGIVDAGETNVGGMGAVSFNGDAGTITFATTTTITLSTSTNYILRLNIANIAVSDEMTIALYPGTITATGVSSGQIVVPADGVIAVLHRRISSGSSVGTEIGGAAPSGSGTQTGGTSGGGSEQGGAPAGGGTQSGGGSGGGAEVYLPLKSNRLFASVLKVIIRFVMHV